MGLSRLEYPYTGGAQLFPATFALGYISEGDVTAYVLGELDGLGAQVLRAFTFEGSDIRITTALPNPCTVVLARVVAKDQLVLDVSGTSAFTRDTLVTGFKQSLMIMHEVLDSGDNALASADRAQESKNDARLSATIAGDIEAAGAAREAVYQAQYETAVLRADATYLDTLATAADRIQTGLDRTQTGLDRVQTTADKGVTAADKGVTAADRVQTGLDKIATAADRVQTGLYAVAADGSADAAAASAAAAAASVPSLASQAEAEAGTNNVNLMTPLRTKQAVPAFIEFMISASTSYTPPTGVREFYVMVYGANGGNATTTGRGGTGGPGYAEKKYTSPFTGAPYTVTIGAVGGFQSAGGTTSFDTVSVTGANSTTSATGGAGGVANGGDFNANGGAGGNGNSSWGGGGGGSATRAGNGGNGGNRSGSFHGSGGGTGGNDAVGAVVGAAATSVAAGAIEFPVAYYGKKEGAGFREGWTGAAHGGAGAGSLTATGLRFPGSLFGLAATSSFGGVGGMNTAAPTQNGTVCILEVY